jgi:hypothetical protein
MKIFPARYHAAMLTALLEFAPLVSAASESNIVRVQFREVDKLFANRIGSTMLLL